MKTPHRIDLHYKSNVAYDPLNIDYNESLTEKLTSIPCLVNAVSKVQLMKEYGTYNEQVIIVRFLQKKPRFDYAMYKGDKYIIEDGIDAPIKDAYRLRRVANL